MRGLLCFIASATFVAALAGPARAERPIPNEAKPAIFSVVQFPVVKLDKQTMRLAPGGQIRDESNLIVLPTSLSGDYKVLYTLDTRGEVFRVWILTAEEMQRFKSRK